MPEHLNGDLIRRAQEGEPSVVGEIYERYQRGIYRYLYYRIGDLHTAEDLTSEVFLRMIEKLPNYSGHSLAFRAWLFQIARNLSIDHYRRMSVRKNVQLVEEHPEGKDEPLEMITKELTSQKLYHALVKLPENQRDVIVMRFVVGMPVREVAETLHKSENSVKGLQRRALKSLRETLVEWEVTYV
ncbi:MAG: RNA polymerase sigma factor [Anaerolineales bacterium]